MSDLETYRCKTCLEFSHIPGKCYLCGGKKEKRAADVIEQIVRQAWGDMVRFYEGGDGCHIEIKGIEHPHFYGNLPRGAWKKAAEWTLLLGAK